jgi:hypothetical protein
LRSHGIVGAQDDLPCNRSLVPWLEDDRNVVTPPRGDGQDRVANSKGIVVYMEVDIQVGAAPVQQVQGTALTRPNLHRLKGEADFRQGGDIEVRRQTLTGNRNVEEPGR